MRVGERTAEMISGNADAGLVLTVNRPRRRRRRDPFDCFDLFYRNSSIAEVTIFQWPRHETSQTSSKDTNRDLLGHLVKSYATSITRWSGVAPRSKQDGYLV